MDLTEQYETSTTAITHVGPLFIIFNNWIVVINICFKNPAFRSQKESRMHIWLLYTCLEFLPLEKKKPENKLLSILYHFYGNWFLILQEFLHMSTHFTVCVSLFVCLSQATLLHRIIYIHHGTYQARYHQHISSLIS